MKPLTIAPAAFALSAVLLTGCKGSAQAQEFDPCTVQPTRISNPSDEGYPDVWVEGDGEPMDADPCDSDDFVRDSWGRLTPVRKPTIHKPIATSTPKAPVTTKGTAPRATGTGRRR